MSKQIGKTVDEVLEKSGILEFLLCPTPASWLEHAAKPEQQAVLLIDHANCEKKAAFTAMSLIHKVPDDFDLLNKMSKLAREELRHFEQVIAIMKKRDIHYDAISASRYAAGMRDLVASSGRQRLVDTLICGAIIEARSCERFAALAPLLDDELRKFYESLLKSESRHYRDYLTLAKRYAEADIEPRIQEFLALEASLIQEPDQIFRFHSGVPAMA